MNIVKLQDNLRRLSDDQLTQLMQNPDGITPQYLVLAALKEREKSRAEAMAAQGGERPSIAEETVAQARPQGILGLPDETLAGAAMRARILGEQQQLNGMTVGAPQQGQPAPARMADGGSVQFGNLFKNQPNQQPQFASPQYGAPVQFGDIFGGGLSNVSGGYFGGISGTPTAPSSVNYNTPITRQVVPEDRYGAYTAPPNPRSAEAMLANLTPEQRARLQRLGVNLSGVGGVGGVGGAASAAASGAAGVGAGGVGGAGVGGAGFAEGGLASLMPKRMSDGGPSLLELMATAPYYPGLGGSPFGGVTSAPVTAPISEEADLADAQNALNEYGLRQRAMADALRRTRPQTAPRPAGASARAAAPSTAAVSGTPGMSANAPMPPSKAVAAAMEEPASKGSDFLADHQKKISDLLERLGTTEADQERAKNMAIMKAGLAIAAGKDPNFLANVATGAMSGLEDYSASREAQKKTEAARTAAEIESLGLTARLQQAENERRDTAAYRTQALEDERRYKEGYLRALGARSSSDAAQLRAAASEYSANSSRLKDPMLMGPEREALERRQLLLQTILSGVGVPDMESSVSGGSLYSAEDMAKARAMLGALDGNQ